MCETNYLRFGSNWFGVMIFTTHPVTRTCATRFCIAGQYLHFRRKNSFIKYVWSDTWARALRRSWVSSYFLFNAYYVKMVNTEQKVQGKWPECHFFYGQSRNVTVTRVGDRGRQFKVKCLFVYIETTISREVGSAQFDRWNVSLTADLFIADSRKGGKYAEKVVREETSGDSSCRCNDS